MGIRPLSAGMDCEGEVYQTMIETLEMTGDPDLAVASARKAIDEFLSYCNEQAAEASGMTIEQQL